MFMKIELMKTSFCHLCMLEVGWKLGFSIKSWKMIYMLCQKSEMENDLYVKSEICQVQQPNSKPIFAFLKSMIQIIFALPKSSVFISTDSNISVRVIQNWAYKVLKLWANVFCFGCSKFLRDANYKCTLGCSEDLSEP